MAVVAEVWTDSLTRLAEEMADAGASADEVALQLLDTLQLERIGFLIDYLHRRQLIGALERRLYWSPDSRALRSGAHRRVRRPHRLHRR